MAGYVLLERLIDTGTKCSQVTVGVKAWVAHANQEVFGKDAHMFRPERWLESPEIVKPREAYFMTVSFLVFHSPLL